MQIKSEIISESCLEKIEIETQDGVLLAATIFTPIRAELRAVVQINPATGAKARHYFSFAHFLVKNGFAVCVWNYRGCESPRDLRTLSDYRFQDYGLKDMPAVLDYLEKKFPHLPVLMVGHSVGAQQIGFMDNYYKLRGLLAVAASIGFPPYMPFWFRLRTYLYFNFWAPLSHWFFGYVAGRRLGFMEDLPSGVVQEWRDWCFRRKYFFDENLGLEIEVLNRFKNYSFPVCIFVSSDDPIANPRASSEYWKNVKSIFRISMERLDPMLVPSKKIGHFGYFSKMNEKYIWPLMLKALDQFLVEKSDSTQIKNQEGPL